MRLLLTVAADGPCAQTMADIDEDETKMTEKSARHLVARDGDAFWFHNPQIVSACCVPRLPPLRLFLRCLRYLLPSRDVLFWRFAARDVRL